MAFTDNSDVYAAIHEDGLNLIARHAIRQRPSLFNYATQYVAHHPNLACQPVAHTVDVTNHFNALFGVVPPIPILGADSPPVGLNFCVQLVGAKIDFFPGNVINLPPKLNPPLGAQHFAMQVRVCGGLDCPGDDLIDGLQPTPPSGSKTNDREPPPPPPYVPPTRKLQCFCLDAFVVAHLAVENILGKPSLVGKVDGVDIPEIQPAGLSANIDCYLRTMFAVLLKEKLTFPVATVLFDKKLLNLFTLSGTLTPNPPIPHNPAIEDDQVKVFINLNIT